jgi:hypothetical protein
VILKNEREEAGPWPIPRTVEAMGGNLSLVAEFRDRAPVVLSGIAEDDPRLLNFP